jgi:hypothetical protein
MQYYLGHFLSTKKIISGGRSMFIGETLPFVREFVDEIDQALRQIEPTASLSRIQKKQQPAITVNEK